MKKIVSLLLIALFSMAVSAQKASKGQVKISEAYAQFAKEKFQLSDEKAEKVYQLKVEQFTEMKKTVVPMKEAGKSAEEVKAKGKEINKAYLAKQQELLGLTKKEILAFNKEFQAKKAEIWKK